MLRRHFIINTESSISNDEIWYTSSDGNTVTLSNPSALPEIDTNTYNDGKGVIKFKTDVTSIGNNAFDDCINLTSIAIPNSVTSIKHYAFYGCSSLTSVTIPNSVTSLEVNAFYGCSSLISITIPNSITSIGESTFIGCSALTSIVVVNGNSTYDSRENCNAIIKTDTNALAVGCQNTIIPNSIKIINSYAFKNQVYLTSIIIPNNVILIGMQCFYNCINLNNIIFEGTINEWNNVLKRTYWNKDVPATVVHCTDGDVEI